MTNKLKKAFINFEETLNNTLGLTPIQVINIQASVMKIVDVIEKELKKVEKLEKENNAVHEYNAQLCLVRDKLNKELEFIKKCFYVAKSSGAILLTDYGFEHMEELKEVLL